jgi:hypothetical protein
LFDSHGGICSGRWRLQLHDPPIRLNATSVEMRTLPKARDSPSPGDSLGFAVTLCWSTQQRVDLVFPVQTTHNRVSC